MNLGSFKELFSKLNYSLRTVVILLGAAAVFTFVVLGYVERDILRVRGLVLALILIGLALIVWAEKPAYASLSRRNSR
jgi:hypothetical protein